jgi:hypothetical protein
MLHNNIIARYCPLDWRFCRDLLKIMAVRVGFESTVPCKFLVRLGIGLKILLFIAIGRVCIGRAKSV